MTSKVVVTENFIRCPCCNNRIRLVQHKAHDAVYSISLKSINVQQLIFLEMWSKNSIAESFITKRSLHKALLPQIKKAKLSGFINPINFAARVSELVSAGTDYKGAMIEKISSVKSLERDTIKGPFYRLRTTRVNKVLKKGGILN